ncbi:glycosyltransferase [Acinetobacter indicus]|nr:glycosyltransferase [Acinetobacter indicus]
MILYVHDHKFIYLKGEYYSEGKFTNEVFARYNVFNTDINVLSRVVDNNNGGNLNKIDNSNVFFKSVRGVSFFSVFTKHFFINIFLILKLVKRSNVLIVRLPSFLGIFVLIVNVFFRRKYFVEFVGDPKEALISSKDNINLFFNLFIKVLTKFNKFFVNNADGVIYVTQYDLQKRYPTKKMQAYASNVEVNIKPIRLSIDNYKINNEIKVGLIGSFNNEYKGIGTALKAIKLLKNNNCNVCLHILGSGSLKDYYLEMAHNLGISKQVYFDGSLSGGEAVLNWLNELDLYIQPSRTEGLPRALIEAMSVGLPAIATNVGGIPELLHKSDLIDKDDELSLAQKIEFAIKSQQLRYEMGKRNYYKSLDYDSKRLKKIRFEFWKKAAEKINESN